MTDIRRLNLGILAGTALAVSMTTLARAEMIYEDDVPATAPVAVATPVAPVVSESGRAEERTSLRQVIGASEKARNTVQTQLTQVNVGPARTYAEDETQNLSKSEMMRRERVREELKNEDLLHSRLEELRIRDEKRRMDELFKGQADAGAPLQEQIVVTPITERPGTAAAAPTVVTSTPVATTVTTVTSAASSSEDHSDKTIMTIQPRAGLGDMKTNDIYYNVRPRFATGVSLGLVASDNLSFELGYTYGEYGVTLASTNPYVINASAYGYTYSPETVALKQNVIDAGLKLHFLGPDAKLRPFIGGGGAYSISFLNYDQRILDQINRNPWLMGLGTDYEVNAFEGYLTGGLDLRVNKSISVGLTGRYYQVFSARERNSINNAAMYGSYYNPYYHGVTGQDQDKQYVGGSLARTAFYTIMGGVTFTF